MQARIEQIQNRIGELNTALALRELDIDSDSPVYSELEQAAEGEPRQNLLANRISDVRRANNFTLPEIESQHPTREDEARRLEQYAQWDWYRAEERVGSFNERLEQQELLETANTRLAEIDAELERLNQNG